MHPLPTSQSRQNRLGITIPHRHALHAHLSLPRPTLHHHRLPRLRNRHPKPHRLRRLFLFLFSTILILFIIPKIILLCILAMKHHADLPAIRSPLLAKHPHSGPASGRTGISADARNSFENGPIFRNVRMEFGEFGGERAGVRGGGFFFFFDFAEEYGVEFAGGGGKRGFGDLGGWEGDEEGCWRCDSTGGFGEGFDCGGNWRD
mmetsp:Transcript_24351/g.51375  ORF Transcript_24351/g.51375 Transcript_24351/m.51375 type:complete len:204 (+) Transcript_24351:332-943(+)